MSDMTQGQHEGMRCPVCQTDLLMSERMGVEIDYCPKCRGVWLDRGELDKIIALSDRSGAASQVGPTGQAPQTPAPQTFLPQQGSPWVAPPAPQGYPAYPSHDGHNRGYGEGRHGGGHGDGHDMDQGSFLSRIFR